MYVKYSHFQINHSQHPDPDYSCAYVIVKTNREDLEGHGFTFTIGRGTDLGTLVNYNFRKEITINELQTGKVLDIKGAYAVLLFQWNFYGFLFSVGFGDNL